MRLLNYLQMIRPFTLRDLTLVRRLSEQGVSLHAEAALADNLQPLRGALVNMVVGADSPTFVCKSQNGDHVGFIQLLIEDNRHHAHILYVSPTCDTAVADNASSAPCPHIDTWLALLDHAVMEVGQLGVHSLVAEVSETGPELPVLRRAGFAVYARQDIWLLTDIPDAPSPRRTLRPGDVTDEWDIQLLYANTVPRLVQLVEPVPPSEKGEAWVLRENEELEAFVHIHEGPVATWLRFFIHPNVESDAREIVAAALQVLSTKASRPVYCCVRRYEGWLPSALERTGFRIWGSQAVMVKHTVKHAQTRMPRLSAVMEGQGVPVSSPFIQRHHHRNGS